MLSLTGIKFQRVTSKVTKLIRKRLTVIAKSILLEKKEFNCLNKIHSLAMLFVSEPTEGSENALWIHVIFSSTLLSSVKDEIQTLTSCD